MKCPKCEKEMELKVKRYCFGLIIKYYCRKCKVKIDKEELR